jgi:hypothetical protein
MRKVLIVAAGFLIAFGMVPRLVGQPGGATAEAVADHIGKKLNEAKIPSSPPAEDAEFLRRVFLDLTGRIPAYERPWVSSIVKTPRDGRS